MLSVYPFNHLCNFISCVFLNNYSFTVELYQEASRQSIQSIRPGTMFRILDLDRTTPESFKELVPVFECYLDLYKPSVFVSFVLPRYKNHASVRSKIESWKLGSPSKEICCTLSIKSNIVTYIKRVSTPTDWFVESEHIENGRVPTLEYTTCISTLRSTQDSIADSCAINT